MGGRSSAETTSVSSVQTTNIADSFNNTLNRIANLSEVGNVSISTPTGGGTSASLPVMGVAIVAIIGFVMILRKQL